MDIFAGVPIELILAAVGGLLFILALAFGARRMFGGDRDEVIERLERATSGGFEMGSSDQKAPDRSVARIARILRPLARLVRPTSGGEDASRLYEKLTHAGYRGENAVEIFLGIKLLLPPIAILGLWQLNSLAGPLEFPMDIALAVIAISIAFFLPNLWLSGKIDKRKLMVEQALPDAMDLLVTCVEAGLSLDAAMGRVSQELEMVSPVLAHEFKQTLLEIQAGVRRADAFHRLSTRTGVEDLKTLSAMIIQTEMFGTSVSRALRVHSEGMRTKRMQRAEEKAAMVSVKMTVPLILFILPSLLAVVVGPAVAMIVGTGAGK
jgi:tight adherence protein C